MTYQRLIQTLNLKCGRRIIDTVFEISYIKNLFMKRGLDQIHYVFEVVVNSKEQANKLFYLFSPKIKAIRLFISIRAEKNKHYTLYFDLLN